MHTYRPGKPFRLLLTFVALFFMVVVAVLLKHLNNYHNYDHGSNTTVKIRKSITHKQIQIKKHNSSEKPISHTKTKSSVISETTIDCKHYLGCSPDKDTMPECDFVSQDYLNGKWMDAYVPDYQNDPILYSYQNLCDSHKFKCHISLPTNCPLKNNTIPRYQWQPQTCRLNNFDPTALDKSLGGKTVMFIGDSLMRQQFNSWRFLLQSVWSSESNALRQEPEEFTTKAGNTFMFNWAKYIVDDVALAEKHQVSLGTRTEDWATILEQGKRKIDVIVLNVGHHWHKLDKSFKLYNPMVKTVLEHMKQYFKGEKIIFRTSTPGHYECFRDDLKEKPIDYVPVLNETNDKYNWRKPIVAELQWGQEAERIGLDNFWYLNVSHSVFRSDAHGEFNIRNGNRNIDCLHWCLPGVPDSWNHFLYNLLLTQ